MNKMTPPKCFFKRPQEYYNNPAPTIHMNSPSLQEITYECESLLKNHKPISSQSHAASTTVSQCVDFPLDLSCSKISESDLVSTSAKGITMCQTNTDILQNSLLHNLNKLIQEQKSISNRDFMCNINLMEKLFCLTNVRPTCNQGDKNKKSSKLFLSPPLPVSNLLKSSWSSLNHNPSLLLDPKLIAAEKYRYLSSPDSNSISESIPDNSSETSSHCAINTKKNGIFRSQHKRKLDNSTGKMVRPFKLYKNNDSQSVFEALGITHEDERWLKNVIEHKNVDDIFQFLTDVMNNKFDATQNDFTDEILEKVKSKFGYIFQNCNTTISNPRMVRHPDMTPKELKTEEYWEKRRKNNEAAKRSREARRNKEESLTKRCEELQSENNQLRKEIEQVKVQIDEAKRNIS